MLQAGMATLLLGLVLILLCFAVTPSFAQTCAPRKVALTDQSEDWGSVSAFYDIGQGMSKGMQAHLDGEYLNKLASIWDTAKKEDGGTDVDKIINNVMYVLKKQVGAIIFLIIGAIFVIGLPIAGLIFCCCRCKGHCGAKGSKPRGATRCGKWMLPIYLCLLAVSFVFIVTGMTIYGISVENTNKNIDKLSVRAENIANDLARVVVAAADDVNCKMAMQVDELFANVSAEIKNAPTEIFGKFESDYGFDDMKFIDSLSPDSFSNRTQTISNSVAAAQTQLNLLKTLALSDASLEEIDGKLGELVAINTAVANLEGPYQTTRDAVESPFQEVTVKLGTVKGNVNQSIEEALKTLSDTHTSVMKITTTINETVNDINKEVKDASDEMDDVQKNVDDFSGRSSVVAGVKAIILVPCCLVCFAALVVFAFGILRVLQNICSLHFLSGFTSIGGHFATCGIVCAFLLGWIVMVIASIVFLGGYSLETVCLPLFRDDEMRIFSLIPELNFSIQSDYFSTAINLGEVLRGCKQDDSIFSTMHGSDLMSESAIMKQVNLSSYETRAEESIGDNPLNYTFDGTEVNNLKTVYESLKNMVFDPQLPVTANEIGTANVERAEAALKNVSDALADLNRTMTGVMTALDKVVEGAKKSSNFTMLGKELTHQYFDDATVRIQNQIISAKDYLVDNTFQCRPLYDTWQNLGVMICDTVGRPIQGMWAAAGLAALFFILAIASLALVSGVLFRREARGPNWNQSESGVGARSNRRSSFLSFHTTEGDRGIPKMNGATDNALFVTTASHQNGLVPQPYSEHHEYLKNPQDQPIVPVVGKPYSQQYPQVYPSLYAGNDYGNPPYARSGFGGSSYDGSGYGGAYPAQPQPQPRFRVNPYGYGENVTGY